MSSASFGSLRLDDSKPKQKVIHVDLRKNPIARYPYETDPKNHFCTVTRKDYKRFSSEEDRKLNKRMNTSPEKQRRVCSTLTYSNAPPPSPPKSAPNAFFPTSRSDPAGSKMLDAYRSDKRGSKSPSKFAWHL